MAVSVCALAVVIIEVLSVFPKPHQPTAQNQPARSYDLLDQVADSQKLTANPFDKFDTATSVKTHGDIFDKVAGNQTLTLQQADQLVSAPSVGRLNLIPIIQPNPNDEIVAEMQREDFLRRLDAIGNDYTPRTDPMTQFYQEQAYRQNQQALQDLNRLTQIQEDQNYRQILNGH